MRDLLLGGPPTTGDPYAERVARSPELALTREVAASWRRYTLSRTTPLTWRAAEARGRTAALLDRFAAQRDLSPYLALRSARWLALAAGDDDALVAAVARFELSVRQAAGAGAEGGPDEVVIDWPADPRRVLEDLAEGRAPAGDGPLRYRTVAPAAAPTRLAVTVRDGPDPDRGVTT